MKLKKVLKHIDFMENVKIVEFLSDKREEVLLYEGHPEDVPWYIADMLLDSDSNGEAISTLIENDLSTIFIYVKEF